MPRRQRGSEPPSHHRQGEVGEHSKASGSHRKHGEKSHVQQKRGFLDRLPIRVFPRVPKPRKDPPRRTHRTEPAKQHNQHHAGRQKHSNYTQPRSSDAELRERSRAQTSRHRGYDPIRADGKDGQGWDSSNHQEYNPIRAYEEEPRGRDPSDHQDYDLLCAIEELHRGRDPTPRTPPPSVSEERGQRDKEAPEKTRRQAQRERHLREETERERGTDYTYGNVGQDQDYDYSRRHDSAHNEYQYSDYDNDLTRGRTPNHGYNTHPRSHAVAHTGPFIRGVWPNQEQAYEQPRWDGGLPTYAQGRYPAQEYRPTYTIRPH